MRRRAGYGAILALGIFLAALMLAALFLSALSPQALVATQGSAAGREAHERKRESLRIYVWSYYFPGPGRRWQQPYIYVAVEGGYAVRIREILLLEAENRSAIDPVTGRLVARYAIDRIVEPPCLMISLRKLDNNWRSLAALNSSVSHAAVVTWEGKTYYGGIRMPNATLAYPCAPDPDRNSFDLHVVPTPAAANSLVSWRAIRGSCTSQWSGNELKITCSAYAVVELSASDGGGYAFEEWVVEGERTDDRTITIAMDSDYTANAKFKNA
jgi:hypothetical protein